MEIAKEVTNEEVRKVLFAMHNNKASRLDGFDAFFYKKAWSIVAEDVTKAIRDFFALGCMLKELNCTILALVSKCANPTFCKDFRPISCCSTIYKYITKILANRIKVLLPKFINKA